jgi:hypothetical protein
MRLNVMLVVSALVGGCVEEVPAPSTDVVAGTWHAEWTCAEGCDRRPDLTYSDLVTVEGRTVRWHNDDCATCTAEHFAGLNAGGCVDVPAGAEDGLGRATYQLCVEADTLVTELLWTSFDTGDASRWTVHGWR